MAVERLRDLTLEDWRRVMISPDRAAWAHWMAQQRSSDMAVFVAVTQQTHLGYMSIGPFGIGALAWTPEEHEAATLTYDGKWQVGSTTPLKFIQLLAKLALLADKDTPFMILQFEDGDVPAVAVSNPSWTVPGKSIVYAYGEWSIVDQTEATVLVQRVNLSRRLVDES